MKCSNCGGDIQDGVRHFCNKVAYTQSDLNAALVAMVEKCAELVPCSYCDNHVLLEGESHVWRSESQLLTRPCTRALIRAALPADILASVERREAEIEQRGKDWEYRHHHDPEHDCCVTCQWREMEARTVGERDRQRLQLEAHFRALAKDWRQRCADELEAALEAELNKLENPQSGQS